MSRLVALLLALSTVLLAGCGQVDSIRREFVAMRYMQQAEAHAVGVPHESARAVAELDRAVALMPADEELQRRAALLYAAARAWERAIPLFEAQDGLETGDRLAYANCLLKAGRVEAGAQICLDILDATLKQRTASGVTPPEAALLLNDAGYILADADLHVDKAWEAVNLAVEAMPLQAAFVDSLGWAAYRRNELTDAAFYLERARRHSPYDDPEMLYHLGVVYSRQGRHSDAVKVLREARTLAPDWSEVQEELTRISRILPAPGLARVHQTQAFG